MVQVNNISCAAVSGPSNIKRMVLITPKGNINTNVSSVVFLRECRDSNNSAKMISTKINDHMTEMSRKILIGYPPPASN